MPLAAARTVTQHALPSPCLRLLSTREGLLQSFSRFLFLLGEAFSYFAFNDIDEAELEARVVSHTRDSCLKSHCRISNTIQSLVPPARWRYWKNLAQISASERIDQTLFLRMRVSFPWYANC